MSFVADNPVIVAWFVASQSNVETEALLERAVLGRGRTGE